MDGTTWGSDRENNALLGRHLRATGANGPASQHKIAFATDGGAKRNTVSWAIADCTGRTISDALGTEDGIAFNCEVAALTKLAMALDGSSIQDLHVRIAYDSKAAAQSLQGPAPVECLGWWHDFATARRSLRLKDVTLDFVWVPVHGRHPIHVCQTAWPPGLLRRLTAAADDGASRALHRAIQDGRSDINDADLLTRRRPRSEIFGFAGMVAEILSRNW